MRDPKAEGRRWLRQAENDLAFARHALDGAFFHQVCFVAQQAGEKALKAVHFASGARTVLGHSLVGLLGRLIPEHPALESLRDLAAELDLYYVPTRYPNGLMEGMPYEVFTRAQADRALKAAETILAAVRRAIPPCA
jgi:HEPN domain-containing protein